MVIPLLLWPYKETNRFMYQVFMPKSINNIILSWKSIENSESCSSWRVTNVFTRSKINSVIHNYTCKCHYIDDITINQSSIQFQFSVIIFVPCNPWQRDHNLSNIYYEKTEIPAQICSSDLANHLNLQYKFYDDRSDHCREKHWCHFVSRYGKL